MERILTLRAVLIGVVLFVGICLPLLVTHYGREPESRLPGWVVAALAIALLALPTYRYVADRLSADPGAGSLSGSQVGSRSLLYEVSPTLGEWVAVAIASLGAGALLGSIGLVVYEVLRSRKQASPSIGLENGR